MRTIVRRSAVVSAVALAAVVVGVSAPAEAAKKFKPVFAMKLPGEPKGATAFKAATKGAQGEATGYAYNDDVGSLTLAGVKTKAGLTTLIHTVTVNVFGGMDLTDVTFPVTRPALITYSYSKTTVKLSDPTHPKIVAYAYSSDDETGATVTVTSYDPVKGEMRGTLQGFLQYHQNEQDPNDDARDGEVVEINNAKFALKPLTE
jgi:hypothetical protein